ncbi:sigma-54-dependent transcriptional regulator [Rhodobium gokarnense]|uniref:Two-component system C4-dicarboxylate transport response regulator DctD n=1 Tax=Rhodobium gokarnense TaxID=364296 RepID=A0ABT3H922_9HYPH|nr:sigma-54 dependent transcriptional regulator [Rhodobium gokarnense]MCW2306839.1 two-component system C4-dicarboxylate transport response regulator DctD [Rhodobium gokarnense]
MEHSTVLLVDDEADLRDALAQGLELGGHNVHTYADGDTVLDHVNRTLYGVLVTDIRMPRNDGLTLMRRAFDIDPAFPVILITGHGDVPLAVEAMRAGAYDFMEKPFPASRLNDTVLRALHTRRLVLENRALRQALDEETGLIARLIGRTPVMQRLRSEVEALAEADVDVLLLGETGSGKEVVARALHDEGPRRDKPFVAINCGALPSDIIESELFGHEAGAFTGAIRQRIGKLEHAAGGTVFLDEIESMPLDLQVKLLRVIEQRSIERLGSNKAIPLDVRFVAATKVDLEEACADGRFRSDLYYRLNVVTVTVPPLRERKEDLPILFHHLAREARARFRREVPDFTPELMAALTAHDWPGNVRELRNVADRFVLGLSVGLDGEEPANAAEEGSEGSPLAQRVAAYERSLIAAEIKRQDGSLKATYEALGLSRKALYEKMKRYALDKDEVLSEPM